MKPICTLTGQIVHGKGLGRTVGMPTANLKLDKDQTLPKAGVYATRMLIGDRTYNSVTNIGRRPSVDCEQYTTVETYILDFDGDIYDEDVTLVVHQFLREIRKFNSLEEVQEQVQKDILEANKHFKTI